MQDEELLAAFFGETEEALEGVGERFVALEGAPRNLDLVNAIFRPIHSLKGNSAFFGFMGIKRLAHEMESVLDLVRQSKLDVTPELISTLLEGLDALRAMVANLRHGSPETADEATLETLLAHQRSAAASTAGSAVDLRRHLELLDRFLAGPGHAPSAEERSAIAHLAQRLRAELGPATAAIGPVAELRSLLKGEDETPPAAIERIGELLTALPAAAGDDQGRIVARDLNETWRSCVPSSGYNDFIRDFVRDQLDILAKLPGFAAAPAPEPAPRPAAAVPSTEQHRAPAEAAAPAHAEPTTVRVPEERIDVFLNQVGELVVAGSLFTHLRARVRDIPAAQALSADFGRAVGVFEGISDQLQQGVMALRLVSVKALFAKVPRIVRDVAKNRGKDIAVELVGEQLEVDKSLLELLDAPMTHMARNAADHGIEPPDERERLGKPRKGTVRISVANVDQQVVLTIEDDGAGLNLDRIRAKAESLGLIAPGAVLGERAIIDFIFASGVSTAEQVSDVSGRGVGMDVVRRAIDGAGGSIAVTTTPGAGTRFRIGIPKRAITQIIPGYLVRVGAALVVIPLDRVREAFRADGRDLLSIGTSGGAARSVLRRGHSLALLPLHEVLALADEPVDQPVLVTVEAGAYRAVLAVDEVLGVQKVVLRALDKRVNAHGHFVGGALMGDGRVALVLDVEVVLTKRLAASS